jgi:hypothetical protein
MLYDSFKGHATASCGLGGFDVYISSIANIKPIHGILPKRDQCGSKLCTGSPVTWDDLLLA